MPAPPSSAQQKTLSTPGAIAARTAAKATTTRSSAPNAAAAAASARLNSGNAGRATPSGVGNQIGGGGKTSTSSGITRTTVNPAAANANRMAAALRSGTTLSSPGKSNMFGANQTFNKGVNLSSGDLIKGGYGQYQQAPTRLGPIGLSGLQAATARMNPSLSSIVAGDDMARFGTVTSNGEIGSMMGPAGEATFNRAMAAMLPKAPKDQSRVPSVSSPTQTAAAGYRDYDPTSSLTAGPTPVATAQNPARAFPSRPAATPSQVASYDPLSSVSRPPERPITVADVPQLPGGASTARPGVNFSAADYADAGYGAYGNPASSYQVAGGVGDPVRPSTQFASRIGAPSPVQVATRSPMSGQGTSFRNPTIAADYNGAATYDMADARFRTAMAQPASAQDPYDNTIYGDAPQDRTKVQRMADALTFKVGQKAAGVRKLGDRINRALGGTSQDDPNWKAPGNPNARDGSNNNAVKIRKVVEAAKAGDPAAQETLKNWFMWNQWGTGPRPATV